MDQADPATRVSLSSRIADFAAELGFGDIPAAVTEQVRHLMLDVLGCAIAARDVLAKYPGQPRGRAVIADLSTKLDLPR